MVTKTETSKSKKSTDKPKITKTILNKKVKTIVKPTDESNGSVTTTTTAVINSGESPKKSILKVKTKASLSSLSQPELKTPKVKSSSKKVQIILENNIVKEFNKKNQIGVSETILTKPIKSSLKKKASVVVTPTPTSKPIVETPTPTAIEIKTLEILKDTIGDIMVVEEKETTPLIMKSTPKQSKKNNKKQPNEENKVTDEKTSEIQNNNTNKEPTKKSNKVPLEEIKILEQPKPIQPKDNKKKKSEIEKVKESTTTSTITAPSIDKKKKVEEPKVVEEKLNEKVEVAVVNGNKKEIENVIVEESKAKSSSKSIFSIINGFTIVPVSLENTTLKKFIYVKKETNKKWPRDRTLFVCNLPTNCTTLDDVKKYFKNDNIDSVHFSKESKETEEGDLENEDSMDVDNHNSIMDTGVVHLIFNESDNLLSFMKKSIHLLTQYEPIKNGFDSILESHQSQYCNDYDVLENKLDKLMMDYDKKVLENKMNTKKSQGEVDDDGFVLVGPSGGKVWTMEEIKEREEKKKLKNFYSFQQRQQKKDELETLRKKFEEDKQKISKMQASRKFKPY